MQLHLRGKGPRGASMPLATSKVEVEDVSECQGIGLRLARQGAKLQASSVALLEKRLPRLSPCKTHHQLHHWRDWCRLQKTSRILSARHTSCEERG